jgi:hypothetical protein
MDLRGQDRKKRTSSIATCRIRRLAKRCSAPRIWLARCGDLGVFKACTIGSFRETWNVWMLLYSVFTLSLLPSTLRGIRGPEVWCNGNWTGTASSSRLGLGPDRAGVLQGEPRLEMSDMSSHHILHVRISLGINRRLGANKKHRNAGTTGSP